MPDVHSIAGIVDTNSYTDLTVLHYSWASEFQLLSITIWLSQSSTFPLLRRRLSVMPNYTNSTQFFFLICIGLKWSCSDILEGRIESIKAPFLQSVTYMQITHPTRIPIDSINFMARCTVLRNQYLWQREFFWTWDTWLFTAIRNEYSVKVPIFEFQKLKKEQYSLFIEYD